MQQLCSSVCCGSKKAASDNVEMSRRIRITVKLDYGH